MTTCGTSSSRPRYVCGHFVWARPILIKWSTFYVVNLLRLSHARWGLIRVPPVARPNECVRNHRRTERIRSPASCRGPRYRYQTYHAPIEGLLHQSSHVLTSSLPIQSLTVTPAVLQSIFVAIVFCTNEADQSLLMACALATMAHTICRSPIQF